MYPRNDAMALLALCAADAARRSRGWAHYLPSTRLREPSPEKYPGQRDAYLIGAWQGDGSESVMTRQRRRKAERVEAKRLRRNHLN